MQLLEKYREGVFWTLVVGGLITFFSSWGNAVPMKVGLAVILIGGLLLVVPLLRSVPGMARRVTALAGIILLTIVILWIGTSAIRKSAENPKAAASSEQTAPGNSGSKRAKPAPKATPPQPPVAPVLDAKPATAQQAKVRHKVQEPHGAEDASPNATKADRDIDTDLPATSSSGPGPLPLEEVTFISKQISSPQPEFPFGLELTLQTTVYIQSPHFVLWFSGPIGNTIAYPATSGASLNVTTGTNPNKDVFEFSVGYPPLTPRSPYVVVVYSEKFVKLVKAQRVP